MSHTIKTILLIEDDLRMREGLQDNLEFEGYRVLCAKSGEEGLELVNSNQPDLILLDVMLPGIDGIDVCRQLRSGEKSIPIIMLSARGSEIDKVLGLEIGADDYLTKPFGVKELLARIKAVFRRFEPKSSDTSYRIGSIEIDFLRHLV
ncbi:MAG: response regulator, partial [Candidatus Thiodiazotropha sp.]